MFGDRGDFRQVNRQFVVMAQVEEVWARMEHTGRKLNLDCREAHAYIIYMTLFPCISWKQRSDFIARDLLIFLQGKLALVGIGTKPKNALLGDEIRRILLKIQSPLITSGFIQWELLQSSKGRESGSIFPGKFIFLKCVWKQEIMTF